MFLFTFYAHSQHTPSGLWSVVCAKLVFRLLYFISGVVSQPIQTGRCLLATLVRSQHLFLPPIFGPFLVLAFSHPEADHHEEFLFDKLVVILCVFAVWR